MSTSKYTAVVKTTYCLDLLALCGGIEVDMDTVRLLEGIGCADICWDIEEEMEFTFYGELTNTIESKIIEILEDYHERTTHNSR